MYPTTRKQARLYAEQISELKKKHFLPFERDPKESPYGIGFCVVENEPAEIADYEANGWKQVPQVFTPPQT